MMCHRLGVFPSRVLGHGADALFQSQAEGKPESTLQEIGICQESFARAVGEGKTSNLSVSRCRKLHHEHQFVVRIVP